MRKRVLLALVLILALVMSTSCSLIVKDEEVDKQTTIIEMAGQTITKGEVQDMTQQLLDYYEYMYTYYYGYSYDKTNADTIAAAQSDAIDSLVQNAVVDQKLAEYGFDTFTEEELAELEAQAAETYQSYYDMIKTYFFADTELTGDELDEAIKAEMSAMGYPDEAGLLEEAKTTASTDKLEAEMVKDVTVTEEEVQAEYTSRVESAKGTYEAAPASYGTAVSNGSKPYYAPAGYRTVKHILVSFTDEDQTAIDDLNAQISAKESEQTESGADLSADIAALQAELDAKTEAAYTAIQPTIDEIQAKLAEGAAFADLITEYNTDPGMTADGEGYLVCEASTNWVEEFKNAAMALANVGDVSEPVRSSYGIHIIQYAGDVAEGEIGLENVHDELQASLLSTKQSEAVSATLEQWIEEANAKIYADRMN